MIRDEKLKPEIRMAVAHTFKATVSYWTEKALKELMVRVGWQAMYSVNHISENYMNHIGSWIAEGEVLMLCIRESSPPHRLPKVWGALLVTAHGLLISLILRRRIRSSHGGPVGPV